MQLTEPRGNVRSKLLKDVLPGPVERLVKSIFNNEYSDRTLTDLNGNADKLRLGKLSKRTLSTRYEILKDIVRILYNKSLAESKYQMSFETAISELSDLYFSTILHVFGHQQPSVLGRMDLIEQDVSFLEGLTDINWQMN